MDRQSAIASLIADATADPIQRNSVVDPWQNVLRAYLSHVLSGEKVVRAIASLRMADLDSCHSLANADPSEISEQFKTAGVNLHSSVVAALHRLAAWSATLEIADLQNRTTESLRENLLAIKGIGAAFADAILLYGLHRSTYPVDRASYRILVRHGWIELEAGYEEARSTLVDLAFDEPNRLRAISSAFEQIGKRYCKPRIAKCDGCPLQAALPPNGPIEVHDYAD
jgi:endonuclease III related protein